MAEKKLSGIDINGVQDFSARNWHLDVDGSEKFNDSDPYINEGSTRSSVIEVKTKDGCDYVGGVQADLAPHGRGTGHGKIGDPKFRTSVLDIITSGEANPLKISAALQGLSPNSSYTIVSIADSLRTTEIYQDTLIDALRKNKTKSFLLIWRSVLVALSEIQSSKVQYGSMLGVISHSVDGVDLQKLKIKESVCKGVKFVVPERKDTGISVDTNFGYRELFNLAEAHLADLNDDPMLDVTQARNIYLMGLGRSVKTELLRSANARWNKITPNKTIMDLLDLNLESTSKFADFFDDCEYVVFETFVEGQLEARLRNSIEKVFGKTVSLLTGTKVAEAALYAANRLEQGVPIYFDFLPQISTIVQSGTKAVSRELIEQSETLIAGKVYRSNEPVKFAIQTQQKNIHVYLKKETHVRPRKASLELAVAPGEPTPIFLSVEQIPALGRASIQVRADRIGLNKNLDWDAAEILDCTWSELLESLPVQSVPMPKRLVIEPGKEIWQQNGNYSLEEFLRQEAKSASPNWKLLANNIRKAISSDGELPDFVSDEVPKYLEQLNKRALAYFNQISEGRIRDNNDCLRFLTWQFKFCPDVIPKIFLDTLVTRFDRGVNHPFIQKSSSWVLIFQGFGRTVFDPKYERKAIKELLSISVKSWRWREHTACMSFLLSRSKTAHKFVELSDLPLLLERVEIEFLENLGTKYTKFNYAPQLLAGLLRYRENLPTFLLLDSDPLASRLMKIIDQVLADLKSNYDMNRSAKLKYINWLEEIKKYIEGKQGNPDLLIDIYNH